MTTISTRIHGVRTRAGAAIVAAALAAFAPHASGQTVAGADWHRGTTLAGFIGAASSQSVTDAAAGATLGWEFTPHLAIEGRGLWLDAGPGADAFSALLGARFPILAGRAIVPFVSGAVGVYRATFDATPAAVPRFYAARMMPLRAGQSRGWTFNDFVVAAGAGADVALARHLALRPELTVLVVTTRADTRAIPVLGVHLAYHFESHPITPARRVSAASGPR
jgi:hypothetical protein